MPRPVFAFLLIVGLMDWSATEATSAPAAAANQGGADGGLGGGLLLDGLDDLIAPPQETGPAPAETDRRNEGPNWLPNRKELDRLMKDSLDGPPSGDRLGEDVGESPLVTLRSTMDKAGRLIATGDNGSQTRPAQEEAIAVLDELIKKMEQECKSCQNPSPSPSEQQTKRSKPGQSQAPSQEPSPDQQAKKRGKKPGESGSQAKNAAQESSVRLGRAEAQAAEAQRRAHVIKRVWGRLPDRLREQMMQSTTDEFLPEYREEIEKYFEQLAEEPAGE